MLILKPLRTPPMISPTLPPFLIIRRQSIPIAILFHTRIPSVQRQLLDPFQTSEAVSTDKQTGAKGKGRDERESIFIVFHVIFQVHAK